MPNTSPKFQSNFSSDEINRAIGWANDESGGYGLQDTFKTTVYAWSASADTADINLGKYYVELTNPFAYLPVKIYAIYNGNLYDIENYRSGSNIEYVKIYSNIDFTPCDIYVVGLLESHEQLKTIFPEYNIQYVYAGQTITNDVVGAGAPSAYVYKHNTQLPYNKITSDSGYNWVPSEAVLVGWSLTEDGSELVGPIYTETGDPAPTVPYYTSGDITLYAVCRIPVRYYKNNTRISGLETATTYLYPIDQIVELTNPYNENISDVFIEGWHRKGTNSSQLIRYVDVSEANGTDIDKFIDINLTYESIDVSGWTWSVTEIPEERVPLYYGYSLVASVDSGGTNFYGSCYIPHFHFFANSELPSSIQSEYPDGVSVAVYGLNSRAFWTVYNNTVANRTSFTKIVIPHTIHLLNSPFVFGSSNCVIKYGSDIQHPDNYYFCGDLQSWCYNIGYTNCEAPLFIWANSGVQVSSLLSGNEVNGVYYNSGLTLYINNIQVDQNFVVPESKDGWQIMSGQFGGYKLSSIALPDSVSYVNPMSFHTCTRLRTVNGSAEAVPSIIQNCNADDTASITLNVTSGTALGGINNVLSLRTLNISDGVQRINSNALQNCTRLKTIKIPRSLTDIRSNAFNGCTALKDIYYYGDVDDWCNINGIGILMKSCNKYPNLLFNDEILGGDIIVSNAVTSIEAFTFKACTYITSVTIEDGVSVNDGAFIGCGSIDHMIIPSAIIGRSLSFGYFGRLFTDSQKTSYNSMRSIRQGSGSVKYYIPNAIRSVEVTGSDDIGEYAFNNCNIITSIVLDNNISYIDNYAFAGCNDLSNLILPALLTGLSFKMLSGCRSISSLELDTTISYIESYALQNCTALTDINYAGTISQWNSISIDENWHSGTSDLVIHCVDGDIPT